jgi:DME family drug/metabolite transporter
MKKHILAILAAGCLWGITGVFSRQMTAAGYDSPGVIVIRCGLGAVFFGLNILFTNPAQFKVKFRDLWCFLGIGLCSMLFFTYCYFQAISLMNLGTAAILLYTAPSMVLLMSLFIFKEKLTTTKLIALVLAFAGCCFVSGIGGGTKLSLIGILYGLGSGFGYALYSIFARFALERGYDNKTLNFYACALAAIGAGFIWGAKEPVTLLFTSGSNLFWGVGIGFVCCYLPYFLYTYGLSTVETGKASVMASLEPVVATIMGIAVFHEALTMTSATGIALVFAAIVILNLPPVHGHGRGQHFYHRKYIRKSFQQ